MLGPAEKRGPKCDALHMEHWKCLPSKGCASRVLLVLPGWYPFKPPSTLEEIASSSQPPHPNAHPLLIAQKRKQIHYQIGFSIFFPGYCYVPAFGSKGKKQIHDCGWCLSQNRGKKKHKKKPQKTPQSQNPIFVFYV